jgi:hypothetical protein
MNSQHVFVFTYKQRGRTTQWDAVSPGHLVRWRQSDVWADKEVRLEQEGDQVHICVFSQEALEQADAVPAEELADEEMWRRFPGHTIIYAPDGLSLVGS